MRYGRLGFWYRFVVAVARPLLRLTTTWDWRGQDKLPKTGGVIVAANHVSYVDPFALGLYVLEAGRVPKFLAKSSLFEHPLTKRIFIGANQIPVYRGTADASKALGAAVDAVRAGECLLIYPEGSATRDPDCWPMKARTGVARLALETGVPVIPVAVVGTDVVAPPGKKFGRLTRPIVRFGTPLDFSRYEGMENDRYILRSVTDEIMYEIMRLSGQEYVDMYASRAKDESKRAAKAEAAASAESSEEDVERKAS